MNMRRFSRRAAVALGVAVLGGATVAVGATLAANATSSVGPILPRGLATGRQAIRITYVGNSGFLIWTGDKKILIDAAFDGWPPQYTLPAAVKEALVNGSAPFDSIDLVLATHSHADHFSAAPVRQVLEHNPRAVFIGPVDAAPLLTGLGSRVIALDVPAGQRRSREVNGITIDAMALSHGIPPAGQTGIVNLGYLITAGGVKFFHTGDVDARTVGIGYLQSLGLPAEHIDVAFIAHFLLSIPGPLPFITEGIDPRFVVVSHLQYTGGEPDYAQILRNFPSAVVLRNELDSWLIPVR